MLNQAKNLVGAGSYSEVSIRLNTLNAERNELKKTVEALSSKLASSEANSINSEFEKAGEYEFLVKYLKDSNRNALTSLIDKLKVAHKDSVILLIGGDLSIVCSLSGNALKTLKAGDLIKQTATILGGSGGGRPDFAMGAGKDKTKVDAAINEIKGKLK